MTTTTTTAITMIVCYLLDCVVYVCSGCEFITTTSRLKVNFNKMAIISKYLLLNNINQKRWFLGNLSLYPHISPSFLPHLFSYIWFHAFLGCFEKNGVCTDVDSMWVLWWHSTLFVWLPATRTIFGVSYMVQFVAIEIIFVFNWIIYGNEIIDALSCVKNATRNGMNSGRYNSISRCMRKETN